MPLSRKITPHPLQVAPAELEDILIKHTQVKDAGVIGLPDEKAGELPKAYVVKVPGSKISAKELQQYLAGNSAFHYTTYSLLEVNSMHYRKK